MLKKIVTLFLLLSVVLVSPAQQKGSSARQKRNTTQTTKKQNSKKQAASKQSNSKKTTAPSTSSAVKGLKNQQSEVKRKIREQEKALQANRADVRRRLNQLLELDNEIAERQKNIEGVERELSMIDNNIELLSTQLKTLEKQLDERKEKFVKSAIFLSRHQNVEDELMFIFSAPSFSQMYRRLRFAREYATYQRAQGELVKAKKEEVKEKQKQLENTRQQKNSLLQKGTREREALQGQQSEQKKMVSNLQKQQRTIEKVLEEQRRKDMALNAEIDRLVAIEMERARKRAEEEARKKAAEEERAKEEELRKKREAAKAAALENERRVREAREREERLKAELKEAVTKDATAQQRARQAAREAEADRIAAERKAKVDAERRTSDIEKTSREVNEAKSFSSVDRKLSGSFAANKGKLPMPITGGYKIIGHFGQYSVEGMRNVHLDNKGINIQGNTGCQARAVFNGEVSAVMAWNGQMLVMLRHGSYISFYCNLLNVCVRKGQQVSTGQLLGSVGKDHVLHFQLHHETQKLNPEQWLKR